MNLKLKLGIVAAAAMMGASTMTAQVFTDSNPGIVMAGSYDTSKLPEKAHKFLKKHFPSATVVKCEQYYAKGKISVELNTGVDVDFNLKGDVMEVDAPNGTVLSEALVKDVLPKDSYDRLVKDGYASRVESIEFKGKRAIEVEVDKPDPDTYIFDIFGPFIMLED
ncbi:MAG: PepSY-like domain-containing protein [Lachnoclostridium sp.]|nr:PepSY-like domain-containing protein [Lachnoclostridium sp.]